PEFEISYSPPPPDGDGLPTEISQDGTVIASRQGDTWSMMGDDGSMKDFPNTRITVDDEGNMKRQNLEDGSSVTYQLDGSQTHTTARGHDYRETDEGREDTRKKGDSPWSIVKDDLKAHGNPNPSVAEIEAEFKRIEVSIVKDRLKAKGNSDPSDAEIAAEQIRIEKETGKRVIEQTIYAGDTFVIPPKEAESEAPPETPAETGQAKSPEGPDQATAETPGEPHVVAEKDWTGLDETLPNTVVEGKYGPIITKDASGNVRQIEYDDTTGLPKE